MVRYAIDLRSMTRGRGSFARRFSHYEELPPHMAAKVVQEANARSSVSEDGGAPAGHRDAADGDQLGGQDAGGQQRWCTSTSPSNPSTRRAAPGVLRAGQ